MALKWLDRDVLYTPYLVLCLTKEAYREATAHLQDEWPGIWISKGCNATTHTYEKEGKITCIVCLDMEWAKDRDQVDIIQLLVHEAVHVWQGMRDSMGENNPSKELEAYSIDTIAGRLILDYRRQRDAGIK